MQYLHFDLHFLQHKGWLTLGITGPYENLIESSQSIDQGSSFHLWNYRFESGFLHTFLCLNTQLIFERRVTFLLSQTVRGGRAELLLLLLLAVRDPSQALILESSAGLERDFQTTHKARFWILLLAFAPVVLLFVSPWCLHSIWTQRKRERVGCKNIWQKKYTKEESRCRADAK